MINIIPYKISLRISGANVRAYQIFSINTKEEIIIQMVYHFSSSFLFMMHSPFSLPKHCKDKDSYDP